MCICISLAHTDACNIICQRILLAYLYRALQYFKERRRIQWPTTVGWSPTRLLWRPRCQQCHVVLLMRLLPRSRMWRTFNGWWGLIHDTLLPPGASTGGGFKAPSSVLRSKLKFSTKMQMGAKLQHAGYRNMITLCLFTTGWPKILHRKVSWWLQGTWDDLVPGLVVARLYSVDSFRLITWSGKGSCRLRGSRDHPPPCGRGTAVG